MSQAEFIYLAGVLTCGGFWCQSHFLCTTSTWLTFKTCPHKHCTMEWEYVIGSCGYIAGHFPCHCQFPPKFYSHWCSEKQARSMRGASGIVGAGFSSQCGKGSLTSDVTSLRASMTPETWQFASSACTLGSCQLFRDQESRPNSFFIPKSLSSGTFWVPPGVGASLWLFWRKAGRCSNEGQSYPTLDLFPNQVKLTPRIPFFPKSCPVKIYLVPEFSLQNWVIATNWSRELGFASICNIKIPILRK